MQLRIMCEILEALSYAHSLTDFDGTPLSIVHRDATPQNVFVTFDLTVRRFGESVFTTSFFDPNMKHLDEVINPPDFLTGAMANLSGQAADPFKIPPGTATQHDGGTP